MSLSHQPEQPTLTIRSVKLPRRLRSYGLCLTSVHRPGAHLTLPSDPITVVYISDTVEMGYSCGASHGYYEYQAKILFVRSREVD